MSAAGGAGAALGVDLGVDLLGARLATPLLVAAGCGGTGRELEEHLDGLGAFTTRSLTLDPRPGAPAPRLVETAAGALWHTGGHNPGVQGFLATELPWLAQRRVRTVVSLGAATPGEYAELARRLAAAPGVWAVELDLTTANDEAHGRRFCDEPYQAGKAVSEVREVLPPGVPLLAKVAPAPGLSDLAGVLSRAGADALVLVAGVPALAFDPVTWRPALGAGPGTLAGPAVLPVALRSVWDVHAAHPDLPLVGSGGVRTGFDVVQMLLAGAHAVALGTALLRDPGAAARIAGELRAELARHGVTDLARLVGAGHPTHRGAPA